MIFNLLKIAPKNSLNFDCVYSHLKNYLKVQQAIKGCLEQAKIGETQGSYCERLMGIAVCDIATNLIFKTAGQLADRTDAGGKNPHDNFLLASLDGLQEGDKVLNSRYDGSFLSKAGLGTEQIVNKVCLGAVTGDWSVLSDNILSAVDQNEVDPIFGPMFAESRMQGYDPYAGTLSIRYTFTYAAVSGGQRIDSNVEFICDSSKPGGNYCPDGRYTSSQLSSSFSMPSLYVSEGGSKQETVVITDTKARFRYNIIRITHKYTLKNEVKEEVLEESIYSKGEGLFGSCYFTGGVLGAGMGFNCKSIFTDDSLSSAYSIDQSKTQLIPLAKKTYYPGEELFLKLGYSIPSDDFSTQTEFDLAYKAECPSATSGGKAVKLGYKTISVNSSKVYDSIVLPLFEIPTIGASNVENSVSYSKNVIGEENDEKVITFKNLDKEKSLKFYFEIPTNAKYSLIDCTTGEKTIEPNSEIICSIKLLDKNPKVEINIKASTKVLEKIYITYDSISFSKTSITGISYSSFDTIGPGSCTLYLKLLASGKGSEAVVSTDSFDNISNVDSSIIVSNNIKSTASYSLGFKVAQPLENSVDKKRLTFLEFYNPFESASICLDSKNIELGYLFQTQAINEIRNLRTGWSLVNYEFKSELSDSEGLFVGKTNSIISLTDQAYEVLKKDGTSQKINFFYDIVLNDDTSISKNSFQFYVQVKDDCSDFSVYDSEYTILQDKEEKASSDIKEPLSNMDSKN